MGLFKMKNESIYHREGRVQKLRTVNVRQEKLNCLYFYFLYIISVLHLKKAFLADERVASHFLRGSKGPDWSMPETCMTPFLARAPQQAISLCLHHPRARARQQTPALSLRGH